MEKVYHMNKKTLSIVCDALQNGEAEKLHQELAKAHPADIADLYEDLSGKYRMKFLDIGSNMIDSKVLKYLSDAYRGEVIKYLGVVHFKESLREWHSDNIVELMESIDPYEQMQMIKAIGDTHRLAIDTFTKYKKDSVGRNMSLDFILVPGFWTVEKTIFYIKSLDDVSSSCAEVFIVDDSISPVGIVSMSAIISSDKGEIIDKIANHDDIITINANADKEEAYASFSKYKFLHMPVVEDSGRMVGILRADDILKIVEEEVTEDYLNLGGVHQKEVSGSVALACFMRLRWLSVSLINALFSPMIIHLFQDSIQKTISLATLMPIVGSIGGSIGIQAVSVTIKAFSSEHLRERQLLKTGFKEMMIGSVNGLLFGIFLGILAMFSFGSGILGVVLGASMFFCATWAACVGAFLPIIFHKLGYDVALSSGPLVTTITDVSGFFIFLSIAAVCIG
jgi:magnesium transporter